MDPRTTAADLAAALRSPQPPTVLDVRWTLGGPPGRPVYRAAHVPGAAYLDLDTELAGPPGQHGRHPLPEPAVLQDALRRAGVMADRPVVTYDGGAGLAAARAWWVLRWAGHEDVRVLDGGLAAWVAEGHPVQSGEPGVPPGDVVVRPGSLPVLGPDEAAAMACDGVLLDVRAPARYRGETEPVDAVAGHIPGAVNAPDAETVGADGRPLTAEALRARYARLGVDSTRPVGVYCGSGITAAHTLLALAGAGIDATLYPGSWSEWVADPARPVATGAGPTGDNPGVLGLPT